MWLCSPFRMSFYCRGLFEKGRKKQFCWKIKCLRCLFFSCSGLLRNFRDSFESAIQITWVWSMMRIFLDAKFGFLLFSLRGQFCVSGMQELTNSSFYPVTGSCLLRADESLPLWFLTWVLKGNFYSSGIEKYYPITSCSQFLISCWWGCPSPPLPA